MKDPKGRRSFAGAAELARHAAMASNYLKKVCAACDVGDKAAALRALRQAMSELETARAGLRTGSE
jgi:ribosomal protein S20